VAFRYPWNPFATMLPMALLIALAALVAGGSRLAIVGSLVTASFLVQTHISTSLVAGSVVAVALLIHLARRLRAPSGGGSTAAPRWSWWIGVAGGLLLILMWLPPLIDQLANRPGNLRLLAEYLRQPRPTKPFRQAVSAVGRLLAVFPFGHYNEGLGDEVTVLPARRLLTLLATALAALVLAVVARRPHERFIRGVGILTLVSLPVCVLSVEHIVGPIEGYLVIWMTVLTLVLGIWCGWSSPAWYGGHRIGRRRGPSCSASTPSWRRPSSAPRWRVAGR
jgi:hypothetical protein